MFSDGVSVFHFLSSFLIEFQLSFDGLKSSNDKPRFTNLLPPPPNHQDTISVHKPGFYAQRFQDFMGKKVFTKIPSRKLTLRMK